MADPNDPVWTYRGLYTLAALILIFSRLLPLGASTLPAHPDLLFAFTLAWTARRPNYVPISLVAALTLLTDFLFLRPPGLWTAGVVIACEFMRPRAYGEADPPFAVDWMFAAAAIAFAAMLERAVMLAVGLPVPGAGDFLGFVAATVVAYPVAVVASRVGFGVRRAKFGAWRGGSLL